MGYVWIFSVLVDNAKQTKIKSVFFHSQGVSALFSWGNIDSL